MSAPINLVSCLGRVVKAALATVSPVVKILILGSLVLGLTACSDESIETLLGEINTESINLPQTPVPIAGGMAHTLATKTDGTLWAWGSNGYYQLGDGTNVVKNVPTQVCQVYSAGCVTYMTGVVAVAAGDESSYALKSDGTLWVWGANYSGQVGDGTTTTAQAPLQVCEDYDVGSTTCNKFFTNVAAIAAGNWHMLALKKNGTLWSWGDNANGKLGDGTTTQQNTPVRVCAPGETAPCTNFFTGVIALGGGGWYHSIVLRNDGTVWSMGYNSWGSLGDGTWTNSLTPTQACVVYNVGTSTCTQHLTNVVKVNGGEYASVAIKTDGTLWNWGMNDYYQISGAPDTNDVNVALQESSGFTDWVDAGNGTYHTVATRANGSTYGWGGNWAGQRGDATGTDTFDGLLYQTCAPGETSPCGTYMTGLVRVATEQSHNVALGNDGTLWTWGENGNGQLGNGTTGPDSKTPVEVDPGSTDWGIYNP